MYCPQHIHLTSSSCLPAFPDTHQLQPVFWSSLAWISTKQPCHFVLLNSITITRQACPLRAPSNQLTTKQTVPLSHRMRCGMYRMLFLPAFITISKGYYHCERFASPRHRLLGFGLTESGLLRRAGRRGKSPRSAIWWRQTGRGT